MTTVIHLKRPKPDEWVLAQEGNYLDKRHFDFVIGREDTDVLMPDGKVLLKYRPNYLDRTICERARAPLRAAGSKHDDHRGFHTGSVGFNIKETDADGNPVCRVTEFTANHIEKWGRVLPFVYQCNSGFRKHYPQRYAIQRQLAYQTPPEFYVQGTCFTTAAVNRWDETHDAQTPVHVDKQDLKEGFGVLSVLSQGEYTGGELIFPKWRVAADLRTGDLLLADVHQYHGNNSIVGEPGWERICTILYYKEVMQHCKGS